MHCISVCEGEGEGGGEAEEILPDCFDNFRDNAGVEDELNKDFR